MKKMWKWTQSAAFSNRVEHYQLHGLHFQHIMLCPRRAWMYLHNINFAQWYERVNVGLVKHESSYQRDHSVVGLIGISPDRLDWDNRIVYENKGSSGARRAATMQTLFYAVMLSIATQEEWQAVVHILSTHKERTIELTPKNLQELWDASTQLVTLAKQHDVPDVKRIPLCDKCALCQFCGHD